MGDGYYLLMPRFTKYDMSHFMNMATKDILIDRALTKGIKR